MAKMLFGNRTVYYKNYNEDYSTASQIIVCENGIFKKEKINSFCFVTRKLDINEKALGNIEYKKIEETPISMEEKPYMLKKIPHKLIETVLKFYQVYAKKSSEVKINIWYDKKNEKFFLDAPFQRVTTVTVTEITFDNEDILWTDELKANFPQKYELKQRLLNGEIELVMETHSHHNMSCSFSGTDDNNDYFSAVGYNISGVFITVMSYPRFQIRYFISKELKSRPKTYKTRMEDEVLVEEKDIIDYNSDFNENYDFNLFAKNVNIDNKTLFGEKDIEKVENQINELNEEDEDEYINDNERLKIMNTENLIDKFIKLVGLTPDNK